jgi:hypothetical protein
MDFRNYGNHQQKYTGEISGSHVEEYEDDSLLGYYAV